MKTIFKSIEIIVVSAIFFVFSIKHANAQDEKTFYAKQYVMVFCDAKTHAVEAEVVTGKNITIYYDETFKKIQMYFTTEEGTPGRQILTFRGYSKIPITNEINYNEMIMIDGTNTMWYVSFDPTNKKNLFLHPIEEKVVNGLVFFVKILNIDTKRSW
jgi:hypothetical protein